MPQGTPVAISIIDAHAGGIGMLGAAILTQDVMRNPKVLEKRLALISGGTFLSIIWTHVCFVGTSSCHMACSQQPRYINGIWGPYFSAMIPGFWLTEGGQSASGSLIDHVVFSHPQYGETKHRADREGKSVYQVLNDILEDMYLRTEDIPAALTRDYHVLDFYHGNRSPLADPTLRGKTMQTQFITATLTGLFRDGVGLGSF